MRALRTAKSLLKLTIQDFFELGLLGFGSAAGEGYKLQFEGSLGYQLSRRAVVGAEYRTKPDNLAIAREDDWFDLFAAYALTRNVTVTAAYVDLGSIATADSQRFVTYGSCVFVYAH